MVLGVGKVLTPPPNIVSNTRTALVYVAHAEAASLERTQTTCMLDSM